MGSKEQRVYQGNHMITLKEAFEDLHDRIQKQIAETMWTIERIKPMSQKEVERWQGKTTKKKLLLKSLEEELKERQDNLKTLDGILKNYGSRKE